MTADLCSSMLATTGVSIYDPPFSAQINLAVPAARVSRGEIRLAMELPCAV